MKQMFPSQTASKQIPNLNGEWGKTFKRQADAK